MFGFCLSFVSPLLSIGQNPLHSLWINRSLFIAYLSIPLLFCIAPSEQEVIKSTTIFALFYGVVYVVTIFDPSIIYYCENDWRLNVESDIYGRMLAGYPVLTIPLYFYLSHINDKHTNKYKAIFIVLWIMTLLMMIQNRSVLFVAVIFFVFSLWKYSKGIWKVLLIAFSLFVIINPITSPLQTLWQETADNVSDADYSRNISWLYYFNADIDSFIHLLCGRGTESTHLSATQNNMIDNNLSLGIDMSDVGFLGVWYMYGIVPVLFFVCVCIIVLVNKTTVPMYLKITSMHILICGATISYFVSFNPGIWFILFYYLSFSQRYENKTVLQMDNVKLLINQKRINYTNKLRIVIRSDH